MAAAANEPEAASGAQPLLVFVGHLSVPWRPLARRPTRCTKSGRRLQTGQRVLAAALPGAAFLLTPRRGSWHHRCSLISSSRGGTMERRHRSFGVAYWCVRVALALVTVLALGSLAHAD